MIKNKLGGIYIIINKISGKVYVGSAIYLKQRWGVHRYELRTGKHDNKHLLAAWNKYGEASFEFKVLEYTETEDDLISREQYYIDLYQSFLPEKGYNLRPKARNNLGFHHPPEAFEKFKRRIPWNKGKTGVQVSWNKGLTKETDPRLAEIGKKISKAERGRPNKNKGKKRPGFHPPKPFPKDIIPWNKGKKMDATFVEMCKQRESGNKRALGHHHTEEAKEKNRQAHLGKPSPRKGTGIIVTKICPNCNAEFVRPVGWANKVACCSTKCGYTYRSKRIR